MRKNGTSDSLPKSNFKQRSNDVDSDSEGEFWKDYIKVSKEENLTLKRICKGMPVNENNKNEEMQSTSSDSTVKGARGTGDLITAIEGPSTSTARGDAALSSGSIQSKRFEDTENVSYITFPVYDTIIERISSQDVDTVDRIFRYEFSSPDQLQTKPKIGIIEYLCPVGYEFLEDDRPLECSYENFETIGNVKSHLLMAHKPPKYKNRRKHPKKGRSDVPIERIIYRY